MKISNVKCSNCGANLQIEEGKQNQFCSYCGNQLILENENSTTTTTNINHNSNVSHTYVDQAKIEKLKIEREIQLKKEEEKRRQAEMYRDTNKKLLIAWIASLVVFFIASLFTLDNVNFSPFHIFIIIDIIVGISVIKKRSQK